MKASASASPLLGRATARASQHTALVGVPDDVYQRIVDRAWADFQARARAAGLTIAPASAWASANSVVAAQTAPLNEPPQRNAAAEAFLGRDGNVSRHVSPAGMRNYTRATLDGAGAALGSLDRHIGEVTKATGAPTGLFLAVVDFAATSSSNSNFMGRFGNRASVETSAGLSLRPNVSSIHIQTPADAACTGYCPNGGGRATSLAVASQEAFGTTRDAMSGGESAANALASGISALGGIGRSVSANEIVADPAAYERIVGDLLAQANAKAVEALAAAGG